VALGYGVDRLIGVRLGRSKKSGGALTMTAKSETILLAVAKLQNYITLENSKSAN
jgi:hypothetical protein